MRGFYRCEEARNEQAAKDHENQNNNRKTGSLTLERGRHNYSLIAIARQGGGEKQISLPIRHARYRTGGT
jgi:hypothetical protein